MNIIWTNWKVAVWRYRFIGPAAVTISFALSMAMRDASNPVDLDTEVTSLHDFPWFDFLLFSFVGSGTLHAVFLERVMTAKPLSFCWPRYGQSLRGLILLGALPWGVFAALLEAPLLWNAAYFRRGASPELLDICLRFGSAFVVGVATCVGVRASRLVLSKLQWGFLALASFPLGIVAVAMWLSIDTHVTASRVIAGVIAMVVFVFFWLRLGNMQYVARGHRSIIQDAMDKRSQTDVKTTVPSWTDELLLARAERHPFLGIGRYTWASLYRTFGAFLCCWKWTLVVVLVLSAVLAAPFQMGVEIAFLSTGLLAAQVGLPAISNLLLPGGRRERFSATLITVLATSLLLIALAIGMVGLSEIIVVVFGADAGGLGLRLRNVWLACVLVPWMGALQLRRYGWLRTENRALVAESGFLGLMTFRMLLGLYEWPAQARLLLFAAIALCGWAVFLLGLRNVCKRGCLIEQKTHAGGQP